MNDSATFLNPTVLEIVRTLPGPIQRVWDHLVIGELRQKWFAGGTMDPHPGGRLVFEFDHRRISQSPPPEKYKDHCGAMTSQAEIVDYDPPHRLIFTWPEPDSAPHSRVTITLSEKGSKVLLHLRHERLEIPQARPGIAAGWHAHLDLLSDLLEGRQPRDFWPHHTAQEDAYREQIEQGR
ncbi:ATPase [Iodidimonas muriae]|uniref:ATPase n=1 Tax=Iodidimonas muriae TaxID=261467 RepID=A0ABQ2LCR5_9PROT|nr:SRPBCC family protein [Iodidimonas muriae]GER07294.1 ATPase [Kordiimonadales bacterium JCM 17843]GGO11078.1 ATPase [Iodidimonas muriae]